MFKKLKLSLKFFIHFSNIDTYYTIYMYIEKYICNSRKTSPNEFQIQFDKSWQNVINNDLIL